MTAIHADIKRWPQLLSSLPPMSTTRLVLSVLVSMAIHALLVFLVCVWSGNSLVVEPTSDSIDASLNVSFVSLPRIDVVSEDEMDREAVQNVPQKAPPVQSSHQTEPRAEAELVAVPEEREVPDSVAPEKKPLETETTPLIDPEAGRMSAHLVETVVTSKEQEASASGVLGDKSPGTGVSQSFNLETAYQIAREVGKTTMPDSVVQELRFQSRKLYLKNHLGIIRKPPPNCNTLIRKGGFLTIPLLLKNTITKDACEWRIEEDQEKERDPTRETDLEKQSTQERVDAFSGLITDSIVDYY